MSFYYLDPRRRGEQIARRLEQFDDYRVLRRLPRPDEMWCRSMPVADNVIKLGIVDCETTSLDPERGKMIEFSIGTLSIDAIHGDVVGVTPPQSWLEDPAEDLSLEVERLTHITADILFGKQFPHEQIRTALNGVDCLVAHNARFDRAFVTRRFPALGGLPWACSMSEVDWPALGWEGGKAIGALLTAAGFFLPDAHRAAADVWATMCLLASSAPDGRSVAAHLITNAQRPTFRLFAHGAPFEVKDALKAAGYRWSPEAKAWWIEGDPERIANEEAWVKSLSARVKPIVRRVDWMSRHAP